MIRRLSLFLFGSLLGLLFIQFAFPGRFSELIQYFDLDYRVIYHLRQDTIYINPDVQMCLDKSYLSEQELLNVLEVGEVDFNRSQTNLNPCKIYCLEEGVLSVFFELCNQRVEIIDFQLELEPCVFE